ncbi:DUF4412 domain-containing protein [Desulfatirhabdium butyrativorans]|uniref:DUF4412 domain-containing protein n=1 Tax=Desulfatirhabdium butyrativorans TaxID=340467 RepID=UPI00146F948F|nr:DUF4412 domain-containing protein [Desulfatirhabdium butyrativorans]
MQSLWKTVRLLGVWMALLLSLSSSAMADLYWESTQETKGMPGKPDQVGIMKNYLSNTASRIEHDNGITIMDFKSKMIYQLDPATKTYQQINLAEVGQPPADMKGEEGQAAQKMMKSMMSEIQVTPTQEKKQIAGYDCQKYLVSGMMMNSDYWLSKSVPGYSEIKAIGQKMKSLFENNPMMKQMNVAGMVDKLDGFPVQTVMHVMNGTVITTLKTIETKKLDPSLFKIPAGYTLTESGMPAGGMPKGRMMKKP